MNFILLIFWLVSMGHEDSTIKYAECKSRIIDFNMIRDSCEMSNSACLNQILVSNTEMDTLIVLFSDTVYNFDETIILRQFHGRVQLKGSGLTKFVLSKALLNCSAEAFSLKLRKEIKRHDTEIQVEVARKDVALLRIMSSDIVETSWNTRANDFFRIDTMISNKIFLKDSIHFGYDIHTTELLGYVDAWVGLEGINFSTTVDMNSMLALTGLSVDIKKCTFINNGTFNLHALVDMYNVETVQVDEVCIRGKVDYGFLINCSRNILFTNIQSYTCFEPIVPATWTSNLVVEGLYCKESVIDAHPSFNVTYRDVTIEDGAFYWNCRALGVHLENCKFDVVDDISEVSLYLGVLALTEKYEYLYEEYDVFCSNVTWLHKNFNFNGLQVHKCRRFIVDSCVTHAVSVGPGVKEFVVRNSQVGRIASADCNYRVENTIFDAGLQGNSEIIPPLSCSNEGILNVINCQFEGFEGQYLFKYIHWPTTKIVLRNCHFPAMKGFAQSTYMKKDNYNNFYIINDKENSNSIGMFDDVHINFIKND